MLLLNNSDEDIRDIDRILLRRVSLRVADYNDLMILFTRTTVHFPGSLLFIRCGFKLYN